MYTMINQYADKIKGITYNIYGNPLRRRARVAGGVTEELSERYEYTPEGLLKSAISMPAENMECATTMPMTAWAG